MLFVEESPHVVYVQGEEIEIDRRCVKIVSRAISFLSLASRKQSALARIRYQCFRSISATAVAKYR